MKHCKYFKNINNTKRLHIVFMLYIYPHIYIDKILINIILSFSMVRSAILPLREFRGRPREGTTASDVHIWCVNIWCNLIVLQCTVQCTLYREHLSCTSEHSRNQVFTLPQVKFIKKGFIVVNYIISWTNGTSLGWSIWTKISPAIRQYSCFLFISEWGLREAIEAPLSFLKEWC